jgi:hypothetical protein
MRKLPIPVRGSALPVLVPILELTSIHLLLYISWIVLLLWSVLAAHIVAVLVLSQLSRVCTGTGIRLMPIPVQACQYQYDHILGAHSSIVFLLLTMPVPVQAFLQCPYRYWHPYSNNASTDMEHVIIANTSTVIHMIPVLVSYIFANRANTNTSMGISPMPILVLA